MIMITKISYAMAFLMGLGMLSLGSCFFFSPQVATADFGIHFNTNADYSFYYIKAARDIFLGILLCGFVFMKQKQAVRLTLLAGTIIPLNDILVVLSKPYNGIIQALVHFIAICAVFSLILLATKSQTKAI
jgi:hypothetical protein